MDYSSYMAVPAALTFRQLIGGEEKIRNYTHDLAMEGGAYLAQRYGTSVLQFEDQMGSMVDVELPLLNHDDPELNSDFWIDTQLYRFPNVYVSVYKHNGRWYGRHSVQIYNDLSDFEQAAAVFLNITQEINNKERNGGIPLSASLPIAALSSALVNAREL